MSESGWQFTYNRADGAISEPASALSCATLIAGGFVRFSGAPTCGISGQVAVFGEWRPDNLGQISTLLKLPDETEPEKVIAAAWHTWRHALADYLRGPFAFGLMDLSTRELYCARDAFGLLPLFFALRGSKIHVADRSHVVRTLSGGITAHNPNMIADFLLGVSRDKSATYYEGVSRLPPGSWMSFTANASQTHRYWDPNHIETDPDPKEAVEHFRTLFDESVNRCHSAGRSGILLSGGLDSSSIAASLVASGLVEPGFPAFSLTYRNTDGWSDGEHLDRLYREFGFVPHELPSAGHDPLSDLERYLQALDGPYLSYGHSVSFRLQPLAKASGCEVVLCGHGGDEIVSYGLGRLNELARQRRWLTLWREVRGASEIYNTSRIAFMRPYLAHLNFYRRLSAYAMKRDRALTSVDTSSVLSSELAARVTDDRSGPQNPMTRHDHDNRMIHAWSLDQPIQVQSLEVFAICSQADGVRTTMPFYDRQLAEFSLSLPSIYKLDGGVSRAIMRKAMKGSLPSMTLNRASKFDFAKQFVNGLVAQEEKVRELTDPRDALLSPYVNPERIYELWASLARQGTSLNISDAFGLWRVAVLALWLRQAS